MAVPRRKPAAPPDAPGLFGPDTEPPPSASPYPGAEAARRRRPKAPAAGPDEGLRGYVRRLAGEVIAPVLSALERAHRELAAGRTETAEAILAVALEDAGRRADEAGDGTTEAA